MKKKDLQKLLNLNFTEYTNRTYSIGKYDLPYVKCLSKNVDIDYLALYSHMGEYHKTSKTAVCFYQYDILFDGLYGLYNAIYYADKELLKYYKERFKRVKYIVAPDYTQAGDINSIENYYRLFKTRIVAIWFVLEMGIITVPNVTYANKNYFEHMLDGMENTEVVSFSVKGSMKNVEQRALLEEAVKVTVDKLSCLKKIIVYSVSISNDKVREMFQYAIDRGIEVLIPSNSLMNRNKERGGKNG